MIFSMAQNNFFQFEAIESPGYGDSSEPLCKLFFLLVHWRRYRGITQQQVEVHNIFSYVHTFLKYLATSFLG